MNGATLTTSDQQNWTLGNLSAITTPVGVYQLTLLATGSGITDLAGNPLTVGANAAWETAPPLPGDANLDGEVSFADLNVVLANYNKTGLTWSDGDFNGDGAVDLLRPQRRTGELQPKRRIVCGGGCQRQPARWQRDKNYNFACNDAIKITSVASSPNGVTLQAKARSSTTDSCRRIDGWTSGDWQGGGIAVLRAAKLWERRSMTL